MLQIIKQATKNFFNPFGKLDWSDDFTCPEQLEVRCVTKEDVFTQAEVQYLRKVLAGRINEKESHRKAVLETAKVYKNVGNPFSKVCFKMHRQTKAELKKLVELQKKIKHSLITMG